MLSNRGGCRSKLAFLAYGIGIVGAMNSLSFAYNTLQNSWLYFLRPMPSLQKSYGGSWAVITGASAGIGLEIAKILAAASVNIVLIARNSEHLQDAAKILSDINPHISVKIISCDCSKPDFDSMLSELTNLDIAIVVNNVAVHNPLPTDVEDMTNEEIDHIIGVNCSFLVHFTSLLIPILKRRRATNLSATIINVSSLTSQMAMPMLSLYAATKAFNDHFSVNLQAELQESGIEVICLRPGLTVSRMSGISEPSFFCPTAGVMAKACLRMLGCGRIVVAPYWPHALLDWVNAWVPWTVSGKITRKMHQEKRLQLLADK